MLQFTRLRELNASGNRHITTCTPFANTLERLNISYNKSGMTDDGSHVCTNLKKLTICDTTRRIALRNPLAQTLKILNINDNERIGDDDIRLCTNLKELHIRNTNYITTCTPFAHTLEKLVMHDSHMTNDGMKLCTKLRELHGSGKHAILCTSFTNTIKILNSDAIPDDNVKLCKNLKIYLSRIIGIGESVT